MTKFIEQRVDELENQVAKLELIVHELRGKKSIEPSTTNTAEDIIEFEGQQYRKVDREGRKGDIVIFRNNNTRFFTNGEPYKVEVNGCPIDNEKEAVLPLYSPGHGRTPETVDVYELINYAQASTPKSIAEWDEKPKSTNQQRAEIIEKAKEFIDKHDKDTYINIHDNAIIAYKLDTADFGISKCNPSDVFNEHIGKAIALGRALGLDVSEFEQAVQPDKPVIGMMFVGCEGDVREIATRGHYTESSMKSAIDSKYVVDCPIQIINDTNAIYEVES